MKKYMRIIIKERFGICGGLKECKYIVNKKFCDNWGIPFVNRSNYEICEDIIKYCERNNIEIVAFYCNNTQR